jgi:hypothetical protein
VPSEWYADDPDLGRGSDVERFATVVLLTHGASSPS